MDEVIERVERMLETQRYENDFLSENTLRELIWLAKKGREALDRIKDQSHPD